MTTPYIPLMQMLVYKKLDFLAMVRHFLDCTLRDAKRITDIMAKCLPEDEEERETLRTDIIIGVVRMLNGDERHIAKVMASRWESAAHIDYRKFNNAWCFRVYASYVLRCKQEWEEQRYGLLFTKEIIEKMMAD